MPDGMLLRSSKRTSSIADPQRRRRLEDYEQERGEEIPEPIPIEAFVDYGRWYQEREVPEIQQERINSIAPMPGGFRLRTARGDELAAERVIVAAGMEPFAWRPPEFAELPQDRVSHPFDHASLSGFAGQRVVVVGAGQSGLESAALLVEAGAEVEVLVRKDFVIWITPMVEKTTTLARFVERVLYPPIDVGSRGSAWVAAVPDVFRWLPRGLQAGLAYDILQPMGADWLVERLADVPIQRGRAIRSTAVSNGGLRLELDDGSFSEADHLLLATGYRVDVRRYSFLGPELLERLSVIDGYPRLRTGLESSVRGLHFVGAAAARTFGPVMRFVTGSWFAAPAVARSVLGRGPAPLLRSF